MSNTIYIDCNRTNSHHPSANNNEWTYKLNSELLMPRGTSIEIQESFVNKKGINGGSIEIDEDVIEELTYCFYITEEPQHLPIAVGGASPDVPWYRPTLGIDVDTFRGNFDETITNKDAEINSVLKGYWLNAPHPAGGTLPYQNPNTYNGINKTPDFGSFGGCGQVLPQCKWVQDDFRADGNYRMMPVIKKILISIPKGVYGIGELGQLVEDQLSGKKYYDSNSNTIVNLDNTSRRKIDLDKYSTIDCFDGQIYNEPFMNLVKSNLRSYSTSTQSPSDGDDFFLCGADYNDLMTFLRDTNVSTAYANNTFDIQWCRGNPADDAGRTADPTNKKIRPFYILRDNMDDGSDAVYEANTGHIVDAEITLNEFWLYQYDSDTLGKKLRLIGTSNFSFKYDTEKNGFSISGLHNTKRSPSHDRFGNKMGGAGQPVINFKKARRGAFSDNNWKLTPAQRASRLKCIGALNSPETRDMGVMIINWASKTTQKLGTRTANIKTQDCARFQDYFTTESERDDAWKQTIWYRLGFDYSQLNDVSTHNNLQYNKQVYQNYGYTTDTELTNDVIPTISTLANPNEFKPDGPNGKPSNVVFDTGLQLFTTCSYAMPKSAFNSTGLEGMYANSLFAETSTYPTIIADIGGVVASRLPSLSKHPYFLITSDILDNYKDNVKKGDILPLLGVVAKTSLSNQDFITSQNQIVQVLSQDKVVNKISVKILNPDLTAPTLESNSSLILKITLPNKTPLSLIDDKKIVDGILATQNQIIGN